MKSPIITLLIGWLSMSASLFSQQPAPANTPVLPSGPLIAPDAGPYAQWTVTITQPKAKPQPKAKAADATEGVTEAQPSTAQPGRESLQQITVTKTLPIIRVQTSSAGQLIEDRWIVGDAQVITSPTGKRPFLVGGMNVAGLLYSKKDFDRLAWVSPTNFAGVQKVSTRDMLVFKDTLSIDLDGTIERLPVVAYIDLETRLPVALQEGPRSLVYQFNPPPSTAQEVPPDIQAAIKIGQKNGAILNRPAGKP